MLLHSILQSKTKFCVYNFLPPSNDNKYPNSLKISQKQQSCAWFSEGELEQARAGRGPARGVESEARSRVPAVEPRKLGNNPLAAELCEVSRSASSPVFIYSARVCARLGAGGVVGKAKLCSQNTAVAGRASPRVLCAD